MSIVLLLIATPAFSAQVDRDHTVVGKGGIKAGTITTNTQSLSNWRQFNFFPDATTADWKATKDRTIHIVVERYIDGEWRHWMEHTFVPGKVTAKGGLPGMLAIPDSDLNYDVRVHITADGLVPNVGLKADDLRR